MRKTAFWLITLCAALCLSVSIVTAQQLPQTSVTILVNRDGVNVRILPAIGAEVIGFVNAGWTAPANGRSPDNQWVRIDFNGQEGWIGVAVLNFFGDINVLPVADPRSIPYGGFDSPRSGTSDATSPITGRLADSGLRLRAGPTTAYPVLANAPRFTVFPLLGRTANNAWLQVNYNGTLGWVATQYVEIQGNHSLLELPIDGIVANGQIPSTSAQEDYYGTLRLMLARVDLAQPSLDEMRRIWTTVAIGQRAACTPFPPSPSDLNVPNQLLAAFFPIMDPLVADFNIAMSNVRLIIDLWIDACTLRLQGHEVIGQATVQGALNAIQTVDGQFADLRRRLNELIPPLLEVGADECLFVFKEQFDVLKVIQKGVVVRDTLDARRTATGYCIDVAAGDTLRIELLPVRGNLEPLVVVTPLDNPTAFAAVGRGISGLTTVSLGPVVISQNQRLLVIVADVADNRTEPLSGEYALLVANISGATVTGSLLGLDASGNVVVNPLSFGTQSTPAPGVFPTSPPTTGVVCPSLQFTCSQLISCDEARACLQAGNFSLDSDSDGIPCEEAPLVCQ